MPDSGKCRACSAPLLWAVMDPSGKRNPLDVEECSVEDKGAVALNPVSGKARAVTDENREDAREWVRRYGMTVHTSHFSSCPQRERFKR